MLVLFFITEELIALHNLATCHHGEYSQFLWRSITYASGSHHESKRMQATRVSATHIKFRTTCRPEPGAHQEVKRAMVRRPCPGNVVTSLAQRFKGVKASSIK